MRLLHKTVLKIIAVVLCLGTLFFIWKISTWSVATITAEREEEYYQKFLITGAPTEVSATATTNATATTEIVPETTDATTAIPMGETPTATIDQTPTAVPTEAPTAVPTNAPRGASYSDGVLSVDFDLVLKENPDCVGWLYCKDTGINFPVLQGPDNNFYLKKGFNKKYSYNGSIYIDSCNDRSFTDANTIIYGHNMKSGAMFAALEKYKKQSYLNAHPVITLFTPEGERKIRLFSGKIVRVTDKCWQMAFAAPEAFLSWQNEMKNNALVSANVPLDEHSKIITLSTCTYEKRNARFVLFGVLE